MTNTNCLEGIRCPQCGNVDRFMIAANVMAEVTDDGADVASPLFGNGFEWDDSSFTRCPQCDTQGPLKKFHCPQELPPDPEGMNDKRAEWAAQALAAFIERTNTDEQDAVCDLLADLIHWCDRHGIAFDDQLARARYHYDAETAGEDQSP
jgi:hypothetical protein